MRSRRTALSVLTVLAALLLAIGAAACGGDDDGGGAATTAETQAEAVKAGLVSDVGRFNDKSFNQSALEGLNKTKADLGADTRAIESRSAAITCRTCRRSRGRTTTSRSASASSSRRVSTRSRGSSRTRTSRSSTTR